MKGWFPVPSFVSRNWRTRQNSEQWTLKWMSTVRLLDKKMWVFRWTRKRKQEDKGYRKALWTMQHEKLEGKKTILQFYGMLRDEEQNPEHVSLGFFNNTHTLPSPWERSRWKCSWVLLSPSNSREQLSRSLELSQRTEPCVLSLCRLVFLDWASDHFL